MTRDASDTEALGMAIRAASVGVRAPEALRDRVEAQRGAARGSGGLPLLALAGAAAVTACAAILVLVFGLVGGERLVEGPTLARAADAALRPATGPRPGEDLRRPVLVDVGIDGLRFPYWDDTFGLDAAAVRRDTIGGRRAMTVDYRDGNGKRVGYTIVAGRALTLPDGARRVRRGRLVLAVFMHRGATVVTWRRAGHTCVLASRTSPARRLLRLAAWTGDGAIGGYARTG